MIGLFDRYFLVLAGRANVAELGAVASIPETNGDSFVLDWSLDWAELESSNAGETVAEPDAAANMK